MHSGTLALPKANMLCCAMAYLALFLAFLFGRTALAGEGLPEGFVYLRDVDASIRQDMRYAGAQNFTGRTVPGYEAPECVLVRDAAVALKAVQSELRQRGFALKVFDCYRPARAVSAFVAWAGEPDDPWARGAYYPNLPKGSLFPNYIARISGHSRGATIDLTVVPADVADEDVAHDSKSTVCTAPEAQRGSASGIDMGTAFDCFDPKADTFASGLSAEQRQNRKLLLDAMERHGFQNYEKEWWHYTLRNEPFPDTIFDFPILPRMGPRPDVKP